MTDKKEMRFPGRQNPFDTIEFDVIQATIPHAFRCGGGPIPEATPAVGAHFANGYPDDFNSPEDYNAIPGQFGDNEY